MEYNGEKSSRKSEPRSRRRGQAPKGISRRESRKKEVVSMGPISDLNRRERRSKTKRRIITMAVAECFALIFIFGYGFFARRWNLIQRPDDWVPEEVRNQNFSIDLPQYQKQKGHWGVYIFGVDSRGSNVGKETHADVNMICDINHDTGEIKLVSVFRDSYLNIDDGNGYNKINQAYFNGGPNDAAKALNKNLDLNVMDYITFNWKAVADGINLLGGVDMEISNAEFYYINSFITETVEATGVYSQHLKSAGMNHLDGVQAVAYGRLRLMDTDFARTERQRKVVQAAFEKAKKADLATLNQLALTVFPQVATSVEVKDILGLLGDVGKYYIGDTGGFPFARGDVNIAKKGACVIPKTLESNVIELHQFLYGEDAYIPSETVKQISAKISNDTGMYTQGVSVGHVSTLNGSVPRTEKPRAAAETAPKKTKKETAEKETRASKKEAKETTEYAEKPAETEESLTAKETKTPSETVPERQEEETKVQQTTPAARESTEAAKKEKESSARKKESQTEEKPAAKSPESTEQPSEEHSFTPDPQEIPSSPITPGQTQPIQPKQSEQPAQPTQPTQPIQQTQPAKTLIPNWSEHQSVSPVMPGSREDGPTAVIIPEGPNVSRPSP